MRSSSHAGNGPDASVNTKNSQSDSNNCPGGNTLYIIGTGFVTAGSLSGQACALVSGGDAVFLIALTKTNEYIQSRGAYCKTLKTYEG